MKITYRPNPEGYEKVADHILDVFSKIKTD